MKTIFLVKPEEFEIARKIEKLLLGLPIESGILFVGIDVIPAHTLCSETTYDIFVGCSRDLEVSVVEPLVKNTLAKDFPNIKISVQTRRGIDRSLNN